MQPRTHTAVFIALATVLVLGTTSLAQDERMDPPALNAVAPEIVERIRNDVLEQVRRWFEDAQQRRTEEPKPIKVLPTTVELRFELLPRDVDAKGALAVLTTSTHYELEAMHHSEEGGFDIRVQGRRSAVEDNNTILLTFQAEVGFRQRKGGGSVRSDGSARVVLGEPTVIARLGEKSLAVTVTQVGPVKPKTK